MSPSRKRHRPPAGKARPRITNPGGAKPRRLRWGVAGAALFGGLLLLVRAAFPPSLDVAEVPGAPSGEMDGRVRAKIEQVRQAVAADPRSGKGWGRLGSVLYAHELEPGAAAAYRRAAELDSREPRWPYLLARLLKTRDPAAALEFAERAVALVPGYAPAEVLYAELLEQSGDPEAALFRYRKAASLDARCAPCELGLGRIALTAGDLEASREHLERAAALQPRARAPQAFLARVHRGLGNADAARRAAERAGQSDGEVVQNDPLMNEVVEESVSAMGYQRRAALADALGDQAKAESLYRTLLDAYPRDADGHYNLGNLLARLGRSGEAVARYRRALEIAPDKTEARFNLGNTFLNQGRLGDAEREYRAALEAWPDHSGTRTNLANVLARQGRVAEAVPHYRRAVEADPQNPIAHHQLGQILAGQGRVADAISHFRTSLAARPDSGPVHLDLAQALARADDYPEAWRHVVAARETGAEPPADFVAFLRQRMPSAAGAAEGPR